MTDFPPIHPGEILREDFLQSMKIDISSLSEKTSIPESLLNDIVEGKSGFDTQTAKALGAALGTSHEFWLNLQRHWEGESGQN